MTASFGSERKEFVLTHSAAFSPIKLTQRSTNPEAAFPPNVHIKKYFECGSTPRTIKFLNSQI